MKRFVVIASIFAIAGPSVAGPSVAESATAPPNAGGYAATSSNSAVCASSSTTALRSTLPSVSVREGDTVTVAVTGNKAVKPTPTPTPASTEKSTASDGSADPRNPILLMVGGGSNIVELHARTAKNEKIDISLPPGMHATIYGAPPAKVNGVVKTAGAVATAPTAAATPTPTPTSTPTPAPRSGGPTGVLTGSIRNTYIASVTQAPATTDDSTNEVAMTYTIKGEHSGRTSLRVTDGTDCIAVVISVKPPKDRFTLTTGIAYSTLAHPSFTTVTVTPIPMPTGTGTPVPGPAITPGIYVYQTETSRTQSSVPFIGSFRLTDSPTGVNYYASLGFFGKSQSGPLYGLSAAFHEVLLTYGWHSQTVDSLCPNVDSSGLVLTRAGGVPAPIGGGFPTICTAHSTKPFWSLSIPFSTFSNVLDKLK